MPITFDNSYLELPEHFYKQATPQPGPKPQVFAFNEELSATLGFDKLDRSELEQILSAQKIPAQAASIALAYAGHQFGHFVPSLGDGRAALLGEVLNKKGQRFDIQLKGSGSTDFSRRGDGKSSLGPVMREYLLSEAMYHLGVPTTRALLATTTGETVFRETALPGGLLARVASSHVRIGTFEYFAAQQDLESLQQLRNYTINRHYPKIKQEKNQSAALLEQVCQVIAHLVAKWMSVGFIHGVMNTDNMALSGETLDYGPCAFMDEFNFNQAFSFIDRQKRYAYKQQPFIAQWNLARLGDCLSLLEGGSGFETIHEMKTIIEDFPNLYKKEWLALFSSKLGLLNPTEKDTELIEEWLKQLEKNQLDFTSSFRKLADCIDENAPSPLPASLDSFIKIWRQRISRGQQSETRKVMNTHNPIFIPRNHLVEKAIQDGLRGDFTEFHKLDALWRAPFLKQALTTTYFEPSSKDPRVEHTFCGT